MDGHVPQLKLTWTLTFANNVLPLFVAVEA